MNFEELCKLDDRLLALYQEAKKFRVLSENGTPISPSSPERASKLRKDTNFCRMQLWHGVPGERGEVGLKFLAEKVISDNPELHEHYELITQSLLYAMPGCQHDLESRGCPVQYPVPEMEPEIAAAVAVGSREVLRRDRGPVGFGGIIEQLRHLAGTGPEPKWIDGTEPLPNDMAEPVFIVQNEDDSWRLKLSLKYRERLDANEITRWYAYNSVYVCDAKARKVLLSKKLTKESFVGAISWKPVVLTFKDEALERKLATVCTQVITIEPDKNGSFTLDRIHQIVKEVAPALNLDLPDMPAEVLDGWLGDICRTHMAGFPLAYSWPALLTAASVLVPSLPGNVRTNLYVGLIGGVGTGKTSSFERAFWLLKLTKPPLLNLKSGSGEGMAEFIGDLHGAKRLVFVNELAHLLAKVNYQGSTFEQFLNDAYYGDEQTLTIARGKKIVFNCCMTLAGGLPEDKFDELFGAGTIGGFHDRALFGVCPTKFAPFEWNPLEGESPIADELATPLVPESESPFGEEESHSLRPQTVSVDRAVWAEKNRWQKEYGIGGRAAEAGIRAAIIAAAFDNRGTLRVENLGPALAFARYQEFVHKRYAPNPGKTNEGICSHKILAYLKQHAPAPECEWLNRRSVILATNCHDYGPGVAIRACLGLESVGEVEQSKSGRQHLVRLNPDRY
jgi:hypothetical protein